MSTVRRSALVIVIIAGATFTWAENNTIESSNDIEVEPIRVFVWASVPPEVTVTQLLTIRVAIRNRRQVEPFHLGDIDISNRFLDGFELGTVTPVPDAIDHFPGTLTLSYGFEIQAQQTEDVVINLRATKVGIFSGDIDVWADDGHEWATRRLQTEIVEQPDR